MCYILSHTCFNVIHAVSTRFIIVERSYSVGPQSRYLALKAPLPSFTTFPVRL